MKPRLCITCSNCETTITKERRALWARSTTIRYVEVINYLCTIKTKYIRKYVTECKYYTTNTLTEYV